jgi:hypothetical protein
LEHGLDGTEGHHRESAHGSFGDAPAPDERAVLRLEIADDHPTVGEHLNLSMAPGNAQRLDVDRRLGQGAHQVLARHEMEPADGGAILGEDLEEVAGGWGVSQRGSSPCLSGPSASPEGGILVALRKGLARDCRDELSLGVRISLTAVELRRRISRSQLSLESLVLPRDLGMVPEIVPEGKRLALLFTARLHHVDVVRVRPRAGTVEERGERVVRVNKVHVARRLQRSRVNRQRLQVVHGDLNVDDRLGRQARDRGRAVMIDSHGDRAERRLEPGTFSFELRGPARIVRPDLQNVGPLHIRSIPSYAIREPGGRHTRSPGINLAGKIRRDPESGVIPRDPRATPRIPVGSPPTASSAQG